MGGRYGELEEAIDYGYIDLRLGAVRVGRDGGQKGAIIYGYIIT